MRTRSHTEIYMHFTWSTKYRLPRIVPAIEAVVHDAVRSACLRCGCRPLAVDGIEDHVHLINRMRADIDAASFMNRVKSCSSKWIEQRSGIEFEWQEGFGGFSVSPRSLSHAIAYVERQKIHHRRGTTRAEYEIRSEDDALVQGRELFEPPASEVRRRGRSRTSNPQRAR